MRTLIAAAFLAAAPAAAQEAVLVEQSMPSGVTIEAAEAEGPVQVDRTTRTITMKDEQGRPVTIRTTPEILNLDTVHDGSKVKVRYAPATALALARPGQAVISRGDTATLPLASGSPSEVTARVRSSSVNVEEVDRERRMLVVREGQGRPMTVRVPAEVSALDSVNKGDTIVLRRTEPAALSAENKDPEAPVRPRP